MDSVWRRAGSLVGFSLLALFLIGVAGVIWGSLIYINLKTSPSVPWALPAIVAVLWFIWQYLGGKGWPRGTAATRKRLLRANPVARPALLWSLLAGALAIGALAGYWIVLSQLIKMPANPLLPGNFALSRSFIVAITIGASLVAPITEESAVRGYLQTVLERDFRPFTAVALSSLVFALAHITQGLLWPKLLVYFLVGITFGAIAYLNNSILPVIPVHIAGDLIFFIFVWPHDAGRKIVWQTGADGWFWIHIAQVIGFTALSLLAFVHLNQVTRTVREKAHAVRAT